MRTNVTIGSFVPGNERPLCGRFVPGNESAWERNVSVPNSQQEFSGFCPPRNSRRNSGNFHTLEFDKGKFRKFVG